MPFEWRNPIGFTVAICFEYVLITYVCFTAMTTVSIGIAFYLHEISLTKDLKSILRLIDENAKIRKNRRILYTQFIEFVDLHSATKQLSAFFF